MTCWVSQNGKFAPYFYDFLDFLYNMWYTLCVDKILTRFSALVGLKYEQSETKTNNAVSVEKNGARQPRYLRNKDCSFIHATLFLEDKYVTYS